MSHQPGLEIADIFVSHGHLLGNLLPEQSKVVQAIKNCRTAVLGGHSLKCDSCDYAKNAYNSCRNRHCPKCGFTARSKWIEKRVDELLDCPYFHVVFTLPSELRPLILRNKKVGYDILFKAASKTLKEVAAKRLDIELGCIGVLHTWSQTLIDHPHVHFIVPGGGLSTSNLKWIKCNEKYLLPVEALSQVFRGKVLELFEAAWTEGKLKFMGKVAHLSHPGIFRDLLIDCAAKEFVVYAKEPFGGPEAVIKYLGQYTHRIAISNYRLVKMEGEVVYFKRRDKDNPGKSKVMSLHVKEFMRRFLLHVLPKAFVRIRHFGLLGNRSKEIKTALIRSLQGLKEKTIDRARENWKELLKRITGLDADKCPCCGGGKLFSTLIFLRKLNTA